MRIWKKVVLEVHGLDIHPLINNQDMGQDEPSTCGDVVTAIPEEILFKQ